MDNRTNVDKVDTGHHVQLDTVPATAYRELLGKFMDLAGEQSELRFERDEAVALGHCALNERDRAQVERDEARNQRDQAGAVVGEATAALRRANADNRRLLATVEALRAQVATLTVQVEEVSGSFAAVPVRRRLRALLAGV